MNVVTTADSIGVLPDHPLSAHFIVIGYRDGALSSIPNNFFQTWLGLEAQVGAFQIGRGSGLGVGSVAKYDGGAQKLVLGHYVSGGQNLRFVLNGRHEIRTISTAMFGGFNAGIQHAIAPEYGDIVIKNDVWIGDEAMFLGGSTIESGCVVGARTVVPPRFQSEPYGIYAGSPARLVRFRFPEKVREALLDLAWWDMPLDWIRQHNQAFLEDLSVDEGRALEILAELKRAKAAPAP